MLQKKVVVTLALFACLVNCENDSSESDELLMNKTSVNGKTYFIQLKKTGDDDDKPVYTKINHYKENEEEYEDRKADMKRWYNMMFDKEDYQAENLKEVDVSNDQEDYSNYIDEDWEYNPNHASIDLPNITYEIYDAMLENNRHNTIVNSSIVKFFFEVQANATSNVIRFDIDSLENITERIMDAELHIYRLPRNENTTKSNVTENIVRLYQMKDNVTREHSNGTNPDIHKLANVIYISSNYAGWQVFKVKNVVENWRNGENNLGFLITTSDTLENKDSVSFVHRERFGGKYQPSLIVYLDRFNTDMNDKPVPVIKRKTKKHSNLHTEIFTQNYNPCSRHVWYVSFHELRWNNFIIAPTGYMAYQCKGSCKSPLTTNYSNHGKLLSIYERSGVEAASCVPTGYKNLIIMYYDRDSNVVIKEYEDMIVTGCGCR